MREEHLGRNYGKFGNCVFQEGRRIISYLDLSTLIDVALKHFIIFESTKCKILDKKVLLPWLLRLYARTRGGCMQYYSGWPKEVKSMDWRNYSFVMLHTTHSGKLRVYMCLTSTYSNVKWSSGSKVARSSLFYWWACVRACMCVCVCVCVSAIIDHQYWSRVSI